MSISTEPNSIAIPRTDSQTFWSSEWGFPHAITVALGLIGVGAIAQSIRPHTVIALPASGWAWVIVFGPIVALAVLRRWFTTSAVLLGLGSVPMAIVSISAWAILSIPAAVWKRGAEAPTILQHLGLADILTSLPFALAMALVLANLSICFGKRVWPIRAGWVPFQFVHLGILLALGAAIAGASQVQRVRIPVALGATGHVGVDDRDQSDVTLPFAITLNQFKLESWEPKITLIRHDVEPWQLARRTLRQSDTNYSLTLDGQSVNVQVLKHFNQAAVAGETCVEWNQPGAMPAVQVRIDGQEHWLHPQSPFGPQLAATLSKTHALILEPGQPRKFESLVTIDQKQHVIQVNHPITIHGWKLYQYGYDEASGALSRYTILEAVRDPSLGVVYAGLLMLAAGMLIHLWNAAKRLTPLPDIQQPSNPSIEGAS